MHTTGFDKAQLFLLFDRDSASQISPWLPTDAQLTQWLYTAISDALPDAWRAHNIEVSLSCISSEDIRALNSQYRGKERPTNVLSFPADMPLMPAITDDSLDTMVLGDVIVCPEVLEAEAQQQHKTLEQHWAHMLVHSVLHLLGLDHQDENSAYTMESQEIRILSKLGITNPYLAVSAKQS